MASKVETVYQKTGSHRRTACDQRLMASKVETEQERLVMATDYSRDQRLMASKVETDMKFGATRDFCM